MIPRVLVLLLLLGCATAREPEAGSDESPAQENVAGEREGACERRATVTVHVLNRSSMDVELTFGPYSPPRAALGFSRTTYEVARSYLDRDIHLRIARGGLEVSTPPPVPTEYVVCNDATLIIGPRPSYSFFYGEELLGGAWGGGDEEEDDEP